MYLCINLSNCICSYISVCIYVSIYRSIKSMYYKNNIFLELYNYLFVWWRRQKESVQECVRQSKDGLLNWTLPPNSPLLKAEVLVPWLSTHAARLGRDKHCYYNKHSWIIAITSFSTTMYTIFFLLNATQHKEIIYKVMSSL
jgi:hypothetical protein